MRKIPLFFMLHAVLIGTTSTLMAKAIYATENVQRCDAARAVLEEARGEYDFPGAIGAIRFSDDTECVFAVGFSDIERKTPMSPSHRVLAASIGKTIVAAEVVRLSFEGKLDLDDFVSVWLGDLEGYERIPNARTLTIRHLLSHSGGIPDHVYQPQFGQDVARLTGRDDPIPPWKLVRYIFDLPPAFEAGTGFSYSDTGYIILGLIVEKASGEDFFVSVQRNFIEPLALDLTSPSNERLLLGLSQAYLEEGPLDLAVKSAVDADGMLTYNVATEWTGGGFVSNPRDLARWMKAHLSGESMPYDYLPVITGGTPPAAVDNGNTYGLGVAKIPTQYGVMLGHYGWIPGYVSSALYSPEHEMAYSISINSDIAMKEGAESTFELINQRVRSRIYGMPEGQ